MKNFEVIAAWKVVRFCNLAPRELLLANIQKYKLKVSYGKKSHLEIIDIFDEITRWIC